MNVPIVYIIILNWNGLQDTLECLRSVFKLNYDNFNVVVVDNGSSDDSVLVIRRNYPKIVIIENSENLGYTGGNNIGMRYAMEQGADYVWLLNNDTLVDENALETLVTTSNKCRKIGLVSPVIYYYDFPEKIQFCGSIVDWGNRSITHPPENYLNIDKEFVNGRNVCLWGTALLVKSDVIKKIGYLDEKFYAYYEDFDYSIRAIKAGFRNLLEIKSKIYHKVAIIRKSHYYYFMARNEFLMWAQHLSGIEKLAYFRQYVEKILFQHAILRTSGYDECADACLDGTWSGMRAVSGGWDKNVGMPDLMKKILGWRAYFWAWLFRGKYFTYALRHFKYRGYSKIER